MIAEVLFGSISFLLVVLVLTIALCAETDAKSKEDEKSKPDEEDPEKPKEEKEMKNKIQAFLFYVFNFVDANYNRKNSRCMITFQIKCIQFLHPFFHR